MVGRNVNGRPNIGSANRSNTGASLRLLCDLTPEGREIIGDFLRVSTRDRSNWNVQDGQTASVMLPYGILNELAAWCLLHEGCEVAVVVFSGEYHIPGVLGMSHEDWDGHRNLLERTQARYSVYRRVGTDRRMIDNYYAFTGRVQ